MKLQEIALHIQESEASGPDQKIMRGLLTIAEAARMVLDRRNGFYDWEALYLAFEDLEAS